MFVSASLVFDYRSERPPVAVRPLTAVRRGLSGIGWNSTVAFSGEIEAWATKSTPTIEIRRVVSSSEDLGEKDATDPLPEIGASSVSWGSSVCWRSNSIGER
jgi:hypothetical protein